MSKITLNRQNVIIVALVGILWALPHFDVFAVQCISVAFIVIATFLMTRNLEKSGSLSLISSVGPAFLAETEPYFAETAPVVFATEKVNAALNWLGTPARVDGKTCFSLIFYALFALVLFLLNLRDNTAMGTSPGKVDADWVRQTKTLCNTLRDRIVTLNRDTDWNASNFVPLEAQVEVTIGGKRKRKYTDLLTCLKRNNSHFTFRKLWNWLQRKPGKTVFLVLGDPGTGKSVALRKLCLDLLEEAKTAKKVPVYVNLKNWSREWTVSSPPQKPDLVDFIKKTLRGESRDTFTDSFIDNYFQKMLDEGRWYFVFDSFDELPCLMGTGNNSELISIISKLLHNFLTSGNQSGGIIASRKYKHPSDDLKAEVILRIQEFDDVRIQTMLHQYLKHASDVVDKLFREREDLVILCRNPFYLTLLIGYINEWGTRFPKNQMDLYTQFLTGRLKKCEGMLAEENLTANDVLTAAKELAAFMQSSTEYGLECPAKVLYRQLGSRKKWEKRLHLLEYARLCRIGGQEAMISFVHRRFQEYFLAENFRDGIIMPNYMECVRTNSGLRDALALYCEVAEDEVVAEIARYCWETLQENIQYKDSLDKQGSLILINTLYFMADAFRNRKDAIAEFEEEYENFIEENLEENTHFIIQLALVNSMALFDQSKESLIQTVLRIFELQNHWLNDIVMQNCRLIKKIDGRIETQFTRYFQQQDIWTLQKRFRNTDFALSKAQGFGYVRLVHFLHLGWFILVGGIFTFNIALLMWKLDKGSTIRSFANLWLDLYSNIQHINIRDAIQSFVSSFFVDIDGILPFGENRTIFTKGFNISIIISILYFLDVFFKLLFIALPFDAFLRKLLVGQAIKNDRATPPAKQYRRINLSITPIEFLIRYLTVSIFCMLLSSSCHYTLELHTPVVSFISMITVALILFSDIIWTSHDLFFAVKISPDFIKQFIRHMVRFICSICVASLIIIAMRFKIFSTIMACFALLMIATFFVYTLFLSITSIVHAISDRCHVAHYIIPSRIERTELASNIDKLHANKWILSYLNNLLDNKTCLDNEWPENWMENGHRKKFKDDDVERAMSRETAFEKGYKK